MDAKEFLRQYIWLNKEIDRKLEEIARERERATKVTQIITSDRVQVSPHDTLSEIIAKIVDMERQVDDDIDKRLEIKTKIEGAIAAIGDDKLELLLHYRYIDDLDWKKISKKMHYSIRQVNRLHGLALKKIKDGPKCPI